jgi:hypothetical protein
MAKLADAFVQVKVDTSKLKSGLDKVRGRLTSALGGISRKIGRLISGIFKSLVQNIKRAALAITAAIAAIGITSIKMASDVEESENLFEVSMGAMADSSRVFSERVSDALGLFAPDLRKMIGTFNVMLKSIGLNESATVGMSQALSVLANDMASFFNLDPDVAFQKLQAGITGEVEPLKRLGILVSENTVKMFAYKNQIGDITQKNGKLTGSLTEQEKVFARFGVIMESTRLAQGDLARTLPALANRFREFKNTIKDVAVSLGELFLTDVADAFGNMTKSIQMNKDRIIDFVAGIRDAIQEWISEQGGIAGIWEKILLVFGKIKTFIVNDLVPVFKILWDITKRIAETISDITTKGVMATISSKESGSQQLEGGGKKVSQFAFGKDPGELTEKQNIILQSMLDEIRVQTRNTAPI